MAPLVRELSASPYLQSVVAVTAQHREMLDQVLDFFEITPDYDLDIMASRQTLTDITHRVLTGLESILAQEKPDLVLVHGDTTTTFAASLAAFYQKIPVGHVEAGLRTHDKYAPYPEEMNRKMTGALADLHFAPTQTAKHNLLREGTDPHSIFVTGNTAIDALVSVIRDPFVFTADILNHLDFSKRKVIVVDAHRRENLGEPMEAICQAIAEIAANFEDVDIVFSVHRNPAVSEVAQRLLGRSPRVWLLDPMEYIEWANLMNRAWLVITDSGGLQEEAPALGKPVLLLRDTTERPEAIAAGTVWMTGSRTSAIVSAVRTLLHDPDRYGTMTRSTNPYGDGQAARRICAAVLFAAGITKTQIDEFAG